MALAQACDADRCQDSTVPSTDLPDALSPPRDASTRQPSVNVPGPIDGRQTADAQTAAVDASAPVDGADPAAKLPGKYALIYRYYAQENPATLGWFAEDTVGIAEIARDGASGKLQMRIQVCDQQLIGSSVVGRLRARTTRPRMMPVATADLVVTGNSFRSERGPVLIGYEEVARDACPPGTTVMRPGRSWLTSQACTCPRENAPPPTSESDCRVIDSDGDGAPGFTYEWLEGQKVQEHQVIRDSSQFMNGMIAADGRHTASFLWGLEAYTLSCSNSNCVKSSASACSADRNPVVFAPLMARSDGQDWNCDTVLSDVIDRRVLALDVANAPSCTR